MPINSTATRSAASQSGPATHTRWSTGVPRVGPFPSMPSKPSITARCGCRRWAEGEEVVVDAAEAAAVGDGLVALRARLRVLAPAEAQVLDRRPKMMFFSDSVATTRSCVFIFAAEMRKLLGSDSSLRHANRVGAEVLLVEHVDDLNGLLVEVDQLHAVLGGDLVVAVIGEAFEGRARWRPTRRSPRCRACRST